MDIFTVIAIVLVAGLAVYAAVTGFSLAKVKDFNVLVGFVSTAVRAVEQISVSNAEIAQMPSGEEKNLLRKTLALTIIGQYAEKLNIKIDEKTNIVLGYVIEAAVKLLKN